MRNVAASFAIISLAGLAILRAAEPPEAKPAPDLTFDVLLERIRIAASNDDWKKPGWADATLEQCLENLHDQMQRAAKKNVQGLPIALGNVRPRQEGERRPPGFAENQLHITKDADVSHARRSILLADGNIRVSHAEDCIIVARGAAEIGHGHGNLVVAGHFVHTSHDGHPLPGNRGRPNASVLVSGAYLNVSHANGTICIAPESVNIGHANHVTFLNCPKVVVSHETGCERIDAKLPMAPVLRKNLLDGKFKITQIVKPNSSGHRALVIHERDGVEFVLRPGSEIVDKSGKVIPELAGWKLSFVAEDFALLTNGRDDASFYLGRRQ